MGDREEVREKQALVTARMAHGWRGERDLGVIICGVAAWLPGGRYYCPGRGRRPGAVRPTSASLFSGCTRRTILLSCFFMIGSSVQNWLAAACSALYGIGMAFKSLASLFFCFFSPIFNETERTKRMHFLYAPYCQGEWLTIGPREEASRFDYNRTF